MSDSTRSDTDQVVPAETVHALRTFQHDNTPSYLISVPAPTLDGPPATDHELRGLLTFAAQCTGNGDMRVPRQLDAMRVIRLVPEDIGAAIFERTEA